MQVMLLKGVTFLTYFSCVNGFLTLPCVRINVFAFSLMAMLCNLL